MEDPAQLERMVIAFTRGFLASVHRVLDVARGNDRGMVLHFICRVQQDIIALDPKGVGRHLQHLPFAPDSISTADVVGHLRATTRDVRRQFLDLCVNLEGHWNGVLFVLPQSVSLHSLD